MCEFSRDLQDHDSAAFNGPPRVARNLRGLECSGGNRSRAAAYPGSITPVHEIVYFLFAEVGMWRQLRA